MDTYLENKSMNCYSGALSSIHCSDSLHVQVYPFDSVLSLFLTRTNFFTTSFSWLWTLSPTISLDAAGSLFKLQKTDSEEFQCWSMLDVCIRKHLTQVNFLSLYHPKKRQRINIYDYMSVFRLLFGAKINIRSPVQTVVHQKPVPVGNFNVR